MTQELIQALSALNDPAYFRISRLCNMLAALYESDEHISWAGIYYLNPETGTYYLGPFQGKPACMEIQPGKGVIGECHRKKQPVCVSNVLEFPGHIACDAASRSELVIPLFSQGEVKAVLDLDADVFSHFDDVKEEIILQLQQLFTDAAL